MQHLHELSWFTRPDTNPETLRRLMTQAHTLLRLGPWAVVNACEGFRVEGLTPSPLIVALPETKEGVGATVFARFEDFQGLLAGTSSEKSTGATTLSFPPTQLVGRVLVKEARAHGWPSAFNVVPMVGRMDRGDPQTFLASPEEMDLFARMLAALNEFLRRCTEDATPIEVSEGVWVQWPVEGHDHHDEDDDEVPADADEQTCLAVLAEHGIRPDRSWFEEDFEGVLGVDELGQRHGLDDLEVARTAGWLARLWTLWKPSAPCLDVQIPALYRAMRAAFAEDDGSARAARVRDCLAQWDKLLLSAPGVILQARAAAPVPWEECVLAMVAVLENSPGSLLSSLEPWRSGPPSLYDPMLAALAEMRDGRVDPACRSLDVFCREADFLSFPALVTAAALVGAASGSKRPDRLLRQAEWFLEQGARRADDNWIRLLYEDALAALSSRRPAERAKSAEEAAMLRRVLRMELRREAARSGAHEPAQ